MRNNGGMPSIPSGEDRRRNLAIVEEVLTITNNKLKKPATTKDEETFRRLELANMEVAQVVKKYYNDHPIMTDVPELRKLIMNVYIMEFYKWSKDDVISMLTLLQSHNAMKRFGYP